MGLMTPNTTNHISSRSSSSGSGVTSAHVCTGMGKLDPWASANRISFAISFDLPRVWDNSPALAGEMYP